MARLLGHLTPLLAPLARRLVFLWRPRLRDNLGCNLGLKGKLVSETMIARLRGNLAQNSRHTVLSFFILLDESCVLSSVHTKQHPSTKSDFNSDIFARDQVKWEVPECISLD